MPVSPSFHAACLRCAQVLMSAALAAAATGHAQEHGHPPPPPPEAYTACQGKTEGASVTLTMPDGKTLDGICRLRDGQLVAMPARGPGAGGPPPGPQN